MRTTIGLQARFAPAIRYDDEAMRAAHELNGPTFAHAILCTREGSKPSPRPPGEAFP